MKCVPGEHAGGTWRLTYAAASGRSGNLELDANFLLRTPLWPTIVADSRHVGSHQATQVCMLDLHELAAGKLAALLSRTASRDLFDTRELCSATISTRPSSASGSSSTARRTGRTGAPCPSTT